MDAPRNIPEPELPEERSETTAAHEPNLTEMQQVKLGLEAQPVWISPPLGNPVDDLASRRHSFFRNLMLLLSFSLAAFILTAWILVRIDSPFGLTPTGPQEIARAHLRALDRGELRPAYDLFSARYREQVSFHAWHALIVTHWRMFHADVLRASIPAQSGSRATLEFYLRAADDKEYRARFVLIRLEDRWWIDDVHWSEQADGRDFSRT